MAQQPSEVWHDVFMNWPAALPKRGVIVSMLNEPIPFKSFFTKGETLLLERTNPDPIGTRFILISYDAIHLLKLTDPLKESTITAAGFSGQLAKA